MVADEYSSGKRSDRFGQAVRADDGLLHAVYHSS
jgi:hypothetical protein